MSATIPYQVYMPSNLSVYEYLVSKAGLGYLIVYGSQVFKLDLVMATTLILCILATLMYALVSLLEKKLVKN